MQIRSRKCDVCAKAVCNVAGTFATDTRYRDFVSKLFRTRFYELSARTFVANLPKVVSKLVGAKCRIEVRSTAPFCIVFRFFLNLISLQILPPPSTPYATLRRHPVVVLCSSLRAG